MRLDKQWIDLPGAFDTATLTSIRLTDAYAPGPGQWPFLAGVTVQEVPEPATLSLLALGGLAMIRRRRK